MIAMVQSCIADALTFYIGDNMSGLFGILVSIEQSSSLVITPVVNEHR